MLYLLIIIILYFLNQMERDKGRDRYQNFSHIQSFYDHKGQNTLTQGQRESKTMFELKAFNNWIKAVLINLYCQQRNIFLKKTYDLSHMNTKALHVLDIGCGHGQDISKWKNNNVAYLVGIDLARKSLDQYESRWRKNSQPYKLYLISQSGSSQSLYEKIQHTYYDIASSQLCIHYMFDTKEHARLLLTNMIQNLLQDGYLLLTIPDSCSIIKKIRELGEKKGEYFVYGNKHFSIRFKKIYFDVRCENDYFGLEYGFYLEEAIGSKSSEGEITYVNQWLIELENFEKMLKGYGMKIVENLNFIEFYKKYKDEYRDLFEKFKLNFKEGESIKPQFWEIIHLYRVVVAQKQYGKPTNQFKMKVRENSRTKYLSSYVNNNYKK